MVRIYVCMALPEPYTYTVYMTVYLVISPQNNFVCTVYVHGSGEPYIYIQVWPTLNALHPTYRCAKMHTICGQKRTSARHAYHNICETILCIDICVHTICGQKRTSARHAHHNLCETIL
jgi:hypothetical protein